METLPSVESLQKQGNALRAKQTHNPGMQATVTSGLRPPVPGPDADR
jgi:hypothetical protein